MAKVYFDSTMVALQTEVEKACSNISRSPCSKFAQEISDIKSSIDKIDVPSWDDSAKTSFSGIVQQISGKLQSIESSISSTFTLAEQTYMGLKSDLQSLKETDAKYQSHLKNEPKAEDYKEPHYVQGYVVAYYSISSEYDVKHKEWEAKKQMYEESCEQLIDTIDAKVSTLDGIG